MSTENERGDSLHPASSASLVGSEFLISRWEAKAEELEAIEEQQRGVMMGLIAQTLEKARAYRACVKDLRRHCDAANQSAKANG